MLLNCGAEKNLESLWNVRRSYQSFIKEISPEYSLEGLMQKLKLQYFGAVAQSPGREAALAWASLAQPGALGP